MDSSGHTCMDVNECHANIHGCTHKCHNALGFYNCSCNSGYALGLDGRSCNGKKAIIIFVIQKHMILYISSHEYSTMILIDLILMNVLMVHIDALRSAEITMVHTPACVMMGSNLIRTDFIVMVRLTSV